ncbi:MAG: diacylglycerol kinase [Nitrosomonadaceae bacterium]|nr:diacylglycerol kinase [Nitrosomonadaceae bacterium]|tara:strand:+ start:113 stop:1117 length:1005 start_codon:yes stop_codon:yes gene_type:complete
MKEEIRIRKIQTGNAKIGLIFNPLSGRIRKHKDVIKGILGRIPGVIIREAKSGHEFRESVKAFIDIEIDLLVIAAGDGTVQAILSDLFKEYIHRDWPVLAIIPGGTTNMTALDLVKYDDLVDSAKKLSACLSENTLPILLKKHVLCIEQSGVDKVYGMFFAVGVIARAVIFSRSGIKRVGITGEIYSGLIMAYYVVGLLFGRCDGAWAPAKTKVVRVGGKNFEGHNSTLFVSALDRLLFNTRPYWGEEKESLHVTFVKQDRQKSIGKYISSIWTLVSGKNTSFKKYDGYHSHNSSMLEMEIDDDYIVDGESYHAASNNGPLRISAVGPITFLTW